MCTQTEDAKPVFGYMTVVLSGRIQSHTVLPHCFNGLPFQELYMRLSGVRSPLLNLSGQVLCPRCCKCISFRFGYNF